MAEDLIGAVAALSTESQRRLDERKNLALSQYREIVKRADKPLRGDAEKVHGLLDVLNLSVEDFTADVDAWQQHQRLQSGLKAEAELQRLAAVVNEKIVAAEKFRKESEAKADAMDAEWQEASRERSAATAAQEMAQRDLAKIQADHPYLFSSEV